MYFNTKHKLVSLVYLLQNNQTVFVCQRLKSDLAKQCKNKQYFWQLLVIMLIYLISKLYYLNRFQCQDLF